MTTDPKQHLVPSNAGMRLIALLTLYNKGEPERLRHYLEQYFATAALEYAPVKTRLAELKAMFRMVGKLRVNQVVAVDKHQVLAVLESEKGNTFMAQMLVHDDYPHPVLVCNFAPAGEPHVPAEPVSDES
jgi:hypothetical protein